MHVDHVTGTHVRSVLRLRREPERCYMGDMSMTCQCHQVIGTSACASCVHYLAVRWVSACKFHILLEEDKSLVYPLELRKRMTNF